LRHLVRLCSAGHAAEGHVEVCQPVPAITVGLPPPNDHTPVVATLVRQAPRESGQARWGCRSGRCGRSAFSDRSS